MLILNRRNGTKLPPRQKRKALWISASTHGRLLRLARATGHTVTDVANQLLKQACKEVQIQG